VPCFLLDLHRDEALRRRLLEPRLERLIYRPETEMMSHRLDDIRSHITDLTSHYYERITVLRP
jgi:hypothetical protein